MTNVCWSFLKILRSALTDYICWAAPVLVDVSLTVTTHLITLMKFCKTKD